MHVQPQQLGRYQILAELASGGMATAYVAQQSGAAGFKRLVVIKRVHPHLLKDRTFLDMFLDEAKLASLVRHPNVVPVIDVTETEAELFLVLEYVESVSLAGLLQTMGDRGELLDPGIASRIVVDVLAGLGAAHEAKDHEGNALNIVHRDVSPQNIIVGTDGTSRLIDFGIAKAAGRLAHTTGDVMKGKMGYMAPEQTKQRPLDRRADIYAAGVVLCESLSGKRLFDGDDAGDVLLAMLINDVPQLSETQPGIPKEVDALLSLALAQDPDERFDNAAAFQVALEQAVPPAPSRDVAALIERVSGPQLEERRELLRQAQRGELTSQPSLASEELKTETAHSIAGVPKAGAGRGAALVVLGLLALGLGSFFLLRATGSEESPASTQASQGSGSPTSPPDSNESEAKAPPDREPEISVSPEPTGPVDVPEASPPPPSATAPAPPPIQTVKPPPPPPKTPGLHSDPYGK